MLNVRAQLSRRTSVLNLVLISLVIGTSLTIASTGTVTFRLVAGTTLAWSFVLAIQLLAAIAVIVPARNRTASVRHALAAFFDLHMPWSAWLLAWAAVTWTTSPVTRPSGWILTTAAVPAAWTAVLIYRFCRDVLADPHRRAIVRTCAHQAVIWTAFGVIGGAAVGLWPRALWAIGW